MLGIDSVFVESLDKRYDSARFGIAKHTSRTYDDVLLFELMYRNEEKVYDNFRDLKSTLNNLNQYFTGLETYIMKR